jgi:hypothetical protein
MTATNGTEGDFVYNESDSSVYFCTVTGTPATWVKMLDGSGAETIGTDLTVTGALNANGNATLGNAATDVIDCTGRFRLTRVTDAGPMTATNGTEADLVYNESDSKVYVCTVTGTPATWAALH